MRPVLNFPPCDLRIVSNNGKDLVFDPVRKKEVTLTPEEWVRQHLIAFFIQHQGYPAGNIAVERSLTINKLTKRFDVLVYNREGMPALLAECKSTTVALSKEVIFQISHYNSRFSVPYLMVTNGLQHLLFQLNDAGNYDSVKEFPRL